MRNIKCTEKNVGNYSLENFEFVEEKSRGKLTIMLI